MHAWLAVGWPLVWLKATNCHMTRHAWERNACEMALSHSVLVAQACMFKACAEPKQNAMQPVFDGSVDLHCSAEPWLCRAMHVNRAMFWTSLTPHTSRAHTGRSDVMSKTHVAHMWWPTATLLSLTCFESSGLSLQPILGPLQQSCTCKRAFKMSIREWSFMSEGFQTQKHKPILPQTPVNEAGVTKLTSSPLQIN